MHNNAPVNSKPAHAPPPPPPTWAMATWGMVKPKSYQREGQSRKTEN